uniref:Transposase Tc1-like domain-containing protein n=1 Tax=Arundo donax TaxID=35708 RepID=A0A0A9GQ99_ARUDO
MWSKKNEVDLSRVSSIPLHKRSIIRSLACELGVRKSTLHRWFKEGLLRRHSNSLKLLLKEANKKSRLQFCLSMLDQRTLPNEPKFIDMQNIVHVDEKWFNTTKKSRNFYMLPDEEDPYRTMQNKNSIDKVMLLSVVARPRYGDQGHCTFDGKLGVWLFIRKEPVQRRSVNRERGTLVIKTIKVDRGTYRAYLISKVLPAIRAKWPREDAGAGG